MTKIFEWACVAGLLVYLVWVPMPFGSIVSWAFVPLTLPPLLLCASVLLLQWRSGVRPFRPLPLRIWTWGAIGIVLIALLQLIPLPRTLLRAVSPQSGAIWSQSDRVAALGGAADEVRARHPITVDPSATAREALRLIALLATFQCAALLIDDKTRRLAFAGAIATAAVFESFYGVREAALRRYEIWGWPNRLIFDRVTGTFVNPNHFANYLAISLPLALYVGAARWHDGSRRRFAIRAASLRGRDVLIIGMAAVVALGCVGAILLSQSRGGLFATAVGFSAAALILAVRQQSRSATRRLGRLAGTGLIVLVVFGGFVYAAAEYLGKERTVDRFRALARNPATLVGRSDEIAAAVAVWRRFPVLGCGAGAFESVVSFVQKNDLQSVYQHAHDDYVEVGATTGLAGFSIAIAAFGVGFVLIVRSLARARSSRSWRTRTFQLAGATSIVIAATHALYDFNFFMPANAATIAAIAGAIAGVSRRDRFAESAPSAVPLEP